MMGMSVPFIGLHTTILNLLISVRQMNAKDANPVLQQVIFLIEGHAF